MSLYAVHIYIYVVSVRSHNVYVRDNFLIQCPNFRELIATHMYNPLELCQSTSDLHLFCLFQPGIGHIPRSWCQQQALLSCFWRILIEW